MTQFQMFVVGIFLLGFAPWFVVIARLDKQQEGAFFSYAWGAMVMAALSAASGAGLWLIGEALVTGAQR